MAQLRSQISEHLPDVIEVLADAAKEGDVQAARILVERCVPSMRALDQNINVNESVKALSDEELISLMQDFESGIERIDDGNDN
jgi:dihydrodipicolinate synthase/N-acetylneuraminate lyase